MVKRSRNFPSFVPKSRSLSVALQVLGLIHRNLLSLPPGWLDHIFSGSPPSRMSVSIGHVSLMMLCWVEIKVGPVRQIEARHDATPIQFCQASSGKPREFEVPCPWIPRATTLGLCGPFSINSSGAPLSKNAPPSPCSSGWFRYSPPPVCRHCTLSP